MYNPSLLLGKHVLIDLLFVSAYLSDGVSSQHEMVVMDPHQRRLFIIIQLILLKCCYGVFSEYVIHLFVSLNKS